MGGNLNGREKNRWARRGRDDGRNRDLGVIVAE
jgi:hypothetical protein